MNYTQSLTIICSRLDDFQRAESITLHLLFDSSFLKQEGIFEQDFLTWICGEAEKRKLKVAKVLRENPISCIGEQGRKLLPNQLLWLFSVEIVKE